MGRKRGGPMAAVAVATSVLLAGCWWQQPGYGPEHTRHNPFERTLTAATVASLSERWSVTVPGALSEPVTSRDLAYSTRQVGGDAASVQAFDLASGDTAWEHTLPPPGFGVSDLSVPVAFSGDELRVGHIARFPFGDTPCGDLTRLDPETGDVLGIRNVDFPTSAVVTAGTITAQMESGRCSLSGGFSGRLVVRDRATAEVLWMAGVGPEVMTPPTVSVVDRRIYVYGRSSIQAYDLAGCGETTCGPLWTTDVVNATGPVVAARGLVFVFDNGTVTLPPPEDSFDLGTVHALDGATGAEVWRANYGDLVSGENGRVSGIAAAGDTLYVTGARETATGTLGGVLDAYAVDGCGQAECDPLWSAAPLDVPPTTATGVASPVVAGDVVYATEPDAVVAFDAGGCPASPCGPLASVPLPGGPARHLTVSAGHVLAVTPAGSGSNTLTAFGLPRSTGS